MPEWPEVTIVICTYDRPREIRLTIDSLVKNIAYPKDKLRFHIADDGTAGHYIYDVADYWTSKMAGVPVGYTRTERKGWGANVNAALKSVQTEYVYFTEDDYVLLKKLELGAYIAMTEEAHSIGLCRFGLAGHGVTCHLNEVDIRRWMPEYQENESNSGYAGQGKVNTFVIDKNFSTGPFSFYLYSNRPHLVHRRFHETYGYYVEGQTLANTEHAMNHQFRQGPENPYIVCPASWVTWAYDHIGVSRQGTSEDIHEG